MVLLLCASVLLLLIPHTKWHNTEVEIQSTALHFIEEFSGEFSKNYKSIIFQKLLWMVTFYVDK